MGEQWKHDSCIFGLEQYIWFIMINLEGDGMKWMKIVQGESNIFTFFLMECKGRHFVCEG